ncbi:2TM domain-containing protein [Maribacter algarum]|uniref:2TM domain-containing protein n=2 Tax=Maribacter algarum (ex Zhang et al. 2020) TaxID=2578118 RepID=A0A5S3PQ49_9FLAO|nr:2TM domain-containing protein [Maribacter algarum]
MELMDYNNFEKKERAKKRVEELKGFYIHFMVYVLVNIMISTVIIVSHMHNGDSFLESIWDFGTISTWIFWGIGIFFHGMKVFSFNPFLGRDWEERQLKKYMEEDKKQAEKYK